MGLSPIATRPKTRSLAVLPPAPTAAMTLEDLTHAFQFMASQQALDKQWFENVQGTIFEHAERLDGMQEMVLALRSEVRSSALPDIAQIRKDLVRTVMTVEENDAAVKVEVAENDERIKTIIVNHELNINAARQQIYVNLRADMMREFANIKGEIGSSGTTDAQMNIFMKGLEVKVGNLERGAQNVKMMELKLLNTENTVASLSTIVAETRASVQEYSGALNAKQTELQENTEQAFKMVYEKINHGNAPAQATPLSAPLPCFGAPPQLPAPAPAAAGFGMQPNHIQAAANQGFAQQQQPQPQPQQQHQQYYPQQPQYPQYQQQQQQQQPQRHYMGDGDSNDKRRLFDDKIAESQTGRYNPTNPHAWVVTTRNYFVGRSWELKALLEWAENAQWTEITDAMVQYLHANGIPDEHGTPHMFDVDPHKASRDIWSHVNLVLSNDDAGDMEIVFNNVPMLNGFEAWRRIVVPMKPRTLARRHEMYGRIHSPPRAKKLTEMMIALESWDNDVRTYIECGGTPLPPDERLLIALKMMPMTTSSDTLLAFNKATSYDELKAKIREQTAFLEQIGGSSGGMNVVARDGDAEAEPQDEDDDGTDLPDLSGLDEETQSRVILAMMKSGGAFANKWRGGPKPGARPGARPGAGRGAAAGARATTPPRDGERPASCINCGLKGHRSNECPKGRVERDARPCFKCHKPGHISKECPTHGGVKLVAAVANGGNDGATGARVLCAMSEDDFEKVKSRRAAKFPQPRVATFADIPITIKTSQREKKANDCDYQNRFKLLAPGSGCTIPDMPDSDDDGPPLDVTCGCGGCGSSRRQSTTSHWCRRSMRKAKRNICHPHQREMMWPEELDELTVLEADGIKFV